MTPDSWDWTGGHYDSPDPLSVEPGQERVFAGYVLEALLGRGGMGAVYRARHLGSGATVALKMLRTDRRGDVNVHRFQREVEVQGRLADHAHVVSILDSGGEAEGLLYFAMELLPGGSLDATASRMHLPQRVRALAQAARGVGYAHRCGLVHRDLKPQNILLNAAGDAQVTDFGLAKRLLGATQLTQTGVMVGTPLYMSPEHVAGQGKVGAESDVFSLGAILYELVSGQAPFSADSAAALMVKISGEDPPPFAELGVRQPQLELIARKALEKDPALRYRDADAFAEDLERFLAGKTPSASRVTWFERLALGLARRWAVVAGLIAALTLTLAVTLVVKRTAVDAELRIEATRARVAAEEAARAIDVAEGSELLAAALTNAQQHLGAGADPSLRSALARGNLRLAALNLDARKRSAARRGLAALDAALATGADAAQVARARVRLCAQLETYPQQALEQLEAVAPDDPLLALWQTRELLWRDQQSEALERVQRGLSETGEERARLLVLRGVALDRLKREKEGEASLTEARAAGLEPDAELQLLLDHGAYEWAEPVLLELVERGPRRVDHAQLLNRFCLARGVAHRALSPLQEAVTREADPRLRVELLRARSYMGEEVEPALEELGTPEAELLRADLRAVDVGERAYLELSEAARATLPGRGAYVRALAAVDPAAADREAQPLWDALDELVVDRIAPPSVTRWPRDLAWACATLGDGAGQWKALDSLGHAGAFFDADRRLLARASKEDEHEPYRIEFEFEVSRKDGPLGRSLLLRRVGERWSATALVSEGQRLLRARVAGRPAMRPLLHRDGAAELPLPWKDFLSTRTRTIAAPLQEEQELARALRNRALTLAPRDPARARLLRGALGAGDVEVAREALQRTSEEPPSWEMCQAWADYLRVRPHAALLVLQAFPATHLLEPRDQTDLLNNLVGMCGWYLTLLRRDVDTWGPEGESFLTLVDGLLTSDPTLVGLLYARAHIARLLGHTARSERDLAVLARLPMQSEDRFWADLYRTVWIECRESSKTALANLPTPLPALYPYELDLLKEWRRDRPGPFELRKKAPFRTWFAALEASPPASLSTTDRDTILRLDFEGDLLARPGGRALKIRGADPVAGRRGQGVYVSANGGLSYSGRALDPREGTFMAWVRPDWSSPPLAKETDPSTPTRVLFGFQPKPWENELRIWAWRSRQIAGRAYWREGEGEASVLSVHSLEGVEAGVWSHVTYTWSASRGEVAFYMNGRLEGHKAGWRPPRVDELAPPSIYLGCNSGETDEGWSGTLDEVRIFLRALSAAEVAQAFDESQ